MKYLRKPCEVEAIQWLATNYKEIKEIAGNNVKLENNVLFIQINYVWIPVCYGVFIVKENDKCKIVEYDDFYKQYQKQEKNKDKWCYSLDSANYTSDFFDTKEQAIEDAKQAYGKDSIINEIWVGKAIESELSWTIDGECFVENIVDTLENKVGDWAECFSVTDEEENGLTEMINEAVEKWIQKYNIRSNCYTIENATKVWL